MINTCVLICFMIFCHIVDDYYLQGWLASAKQKKWWKENAPNELYKYDYIWALFMHSFSWSFMIMLPILIIHFNKILYGNIGCFYIMFLGLNTIIHALVDNQKANKLDINLWCDQIMHMFQIVFTAITFNFMV